MTILTIILLLWGICKLARFGKIVVLESRYKRELKKQEEHRKKMDVFWSECYRKEYEAKQIAQREQEAVKTTSPPAYRTGETQSAVCGSVPQAETAFSFEGKNAIRVAEEYISFLTLSRNELIEQLKFDGFETDAATIAADYIDMDWNEQATIKAKEYLDFMGFSKKGLIEQLQSDGFTKEQAEYAVSAVGY